MVVKVMNRLAAAVFSESPFLPPVSRINDKQACVYAGVCVFSCFEWLQSIGLHVLAVCVVVGSPFRCLQFQQVIMC